MKKLFGFGTIVLLTGALILASCNKKDEVTEKEVTKKEVAAESIKLQKELALYVDSTFQLKAEVSPEDATGKINWTSSDKTIATVSEDGLVKAIAKGTAIVTANIGNAVAVCNVTVMNNPVTLELKLKSIQQKKCTVSVKASDEEGYYYCGYATPADVDKMTDAQITSTVLKNIKSMLEAYAAYGYNYTLKDLLKKGSADLIASGLTASTDYVMFAFGVDVDSEQPSKTVTRLPFKTIDVVPSSMTFTIEFDSIAKIQKISGKDTTYTYNGYFKCTPSNETEKFVITGVKSIVLDTAYNNDAMKYLTEMEAYYDQNYSSYGGFEGTMVKAGTRDVYFKTMEHNVKYTLIAAGYEGGFSTKATTFEYTFQHPDSIKKPMPARAPMFEKADEIDMTDFRGVYFPGMCH